MKNSALLVCLAVNALAVFLVLNPWVTRWASQAVAVLALEALFFLVIGVPVFLHHFLRRKQSLRQSVSDTVDSVMEFLAGWV